MTVNWRAVFAETATWTVIVRDNYHYQDDDEASTITGFVTAEAALDKCRRLVEASVQDCAEPGRDAATIVGYYQMFGDAPSIISPRGQPPVAFSAGDYARETAARLTTA